MELMELLKIWLYYLAGWRLALTSFLRFALLFHLGLWTIMRWRKEDAERVGENRGHKPHVYD